VSVVTPATCVIFAPFVLFVSRCHPCCWHQPDCDIGAGDRIAVAVRRAATESTSLTATGPSS
jgi:hypothetical protein